MNRAADGLKQAERDLGFAETAIATKYYQWAAFAAQQSAEKALKVLVQSLHGAVRGHSITEMLRQRPAPCRSGEKHWPALRRSAGST